MPRKRIRQKYRTVVPPTVKPFRRKDVLPDSMRDFEPFDFSVNGAPHTMTQEDFDALGARMPAECMVCRLHERTGLLAYVPSDPQRWGAAPGKYRMIWYTLCDPCFASPDWKVRAERMLAGCLGIPGYE